MQRLSERAADGSRRGECVVHFELNCLMTFVWKGDRSILFYCIITRIGISIFIRVMAATPRL